MIVDVDGREDAGSGSFVGVRVMGRIVQATIRRHESKVGMKDRCFIAHSFCLASHLSQSKTRAMFVLLQCGNCNPVPHTDWDHAERVRD